MDLDDLDDLDEHRRANLANWNERVGIHVGSRTYGVQRFAEDPTHVSGVVRYDQPRVGDVAGARLVHLQCHIGTDTVSWARLGARVTGVDFSEPALAEARRLAAAAGADARFVHCDVYASPEVIGETFDIVYASVGALNWLPSIERWVDTVDRLLEPGGRVYVRDGHPMLFAIDERITDALTVRFPYFETGEPLRWEDDATYTDGEVRLTNTVTYEWNHGLTVLSALLARGYEITHFEEHRSLEWQALPTMSLEGERWVLPAHQRDLVPLQYSVGATKRG